MPEQLGVPADQSWGRDPLNRRMPAYEAWCLACGAFEDLVPAGEHFVCRNRAACLVRTRTDLRPHHTRRRTTA